MALPTARFPWVAFSCVLALPAVLTFVFASAGDLPFAAAEGAVVAASSGATDVLGDGATSSSEAASGSSSETATASGTAEGGSASGTVDATAFSGSVTDGGGVSTIPAEVSGDAAATGGVVSSSGTTESGTVVASSGTSAPSSLRAKFAFQIPTYLLEKSDPERDVFTCDPAQAACRINLDLSPTFSGETASAWACELDFGMGTPTGEESKCNPAAVTLTGASVAVRLRAWRKADPSVRWGREILVTVRITTSGSGSAGQVGSGSGTSSGSGAAAGGVSTGSTTGDAASGSGSSASGTGAVSAGTGSGDSLTGSGASSGVTSSGACAENGGSGTGADTGVADGSGVVATASGVSSDPALASADCSASSGSVLVATGAQDAGGGSSGAVWLHPLPVVIVQSGLDGQGRCLKADCSANFASSLSGSAYACAWDLGGGAFSSASSAGSCNPSYAHFPVSSGYRVRLTVTDKSGASSAAALDVLNPFSPPASVTVAERAAAAETVPVAFAPVARIALQGRLSAGRWADGKSAGCVAGADAGCVFNFDGRGSFVASASAARYAWDWGFGSGATGANPPAVRFPAGTWNVRLTVSDAYGFSTDTWSVEVAREPAVRVAAMTGAAAPLAMASASGVVAAAEPSPASVAPRCGYLSDGTTWACAVAAADPAMSVAVPPAEGRSVRIVAQGPWGAGRSFTGGTYACATKADACSVNFSAQSAGGKPVSWAWDFGGESFVGANPPARAFPPGVTQVAVAATFADGTVARDAVHVTVGAMPAGKAAKPAKSAAKNPSVRGASKKAKKTSSPPAGQEENPAFSAEPQGSLGANAPLGWAALAASGASGVSWLLARRWAK